MKIKYSNNSKQKERAASVPHYISCLLFYHKVAGTALLGLSLGPHSGWARGGGDGGERKEVGGGGGWAHRRHFQVPTGGEAFV